MDSVIMPEPASGWRFPVQDFTQRLLARWAEASLRPVHTSGGTQRLEFNVPMAHSELTGTLDGQGRYISFTGDIRDEAEFALWCRSIIPAREVVLCSDQGNLILTPHLSLQNILQAWSPSPV